jgi:hypothetical protein
LSQRTIFSVVPAVMRHMRVKAQPLSSKRHEPTVSLYSAVQRERSENDDQLRCSTGC